MASVDVINAPALVATLLEYANTELLQRGSMKFLGTTLWTSLDYPDRPFGWSHDPEVIKAFEEARAEKEKTVPEAAARMGLPHRIGFWDKKGSRDINNWVGVVTPKSLPDDGVFCITPRKGIVW